MFDYIEGLISELTPTYAVVDNSKIGYLINISLHSYSQLSENNAHKLYIHHVIREDSHQLFGFVIKKEREMFRLLISVSGVGANTARVMLSTLTTDELEKAILGSQVNIIKSVKGIGMKTAQKIIIELKDKLGKLSDDLEMVLAKDYKVREEALDALLMLGFSKIQINKGLDKLLNKESNFTVEELIKNALKLL
ncbi:MAG: Holliday junction branch migration protein RuvA [Bacteroidales bacterium]|nr:Holliday junction branch migration protein RuvA [Bacteroidales bacterium]